MMEVAEADESEARRYLESRRWPDGRVRCPTCGGEDRIVRRGGARVGYYRCSPCRLEFTVRSGTVLHRSHVPLATWLSACWTPRPRDGSLAEYARRLGVNRRTAERIDRVLGPVSRKSIATRIRRLTSPIGAHFEVSVR
jgi:transposase-like protein